MEKSTELKNWIKAMSGLKANLVQPKKDAQAYQYKYATLDQVISVIESARKGTGIDYEQNISTNEDGSISVSTMVLHESGEYIFFDPISMSTGKKPQEVGSAITYGRRYSLQTAFGIAAEEDDDGEKANGATTARKPQPKSGQTSTKPRQTTQSNKITKPSESYSNFKVVYTALLEMKGKKEAEAVYKKAKDEIKLADGQKPTDAQLNKLTLLINDALKGQKAND